MESLVSQSTEYRKTNEQNDNNHNCRSEQRSATQRELRLIPVSSRPYAIAPNREENSQLEARSLKAREKANDLIG